MPDEDGNSRPNSTSTYEYSHEPFETFQNKVLLLARSLGGSNDVEVRYNRGGSYSRVVFARIMRDGAASTGIFRIPCFSDVTSSNESDSADGDDDDDKENQRSHQIDDEVLDQAAVLQFLASRNISAPGVLAFDASSANPIGSPYVFQEYSTGTPLDVAYEHMLLQEKLSVVDSLVEFLLSTEQIKFPGIGSLGALSGPDIAAKGSYLFGSEGPDLQVEIRGFVIGAGSQSYIPETTTTLPDFLSTQLEAWYEQEHSFGENPVTAMWKKLCEILREMKTANFFTSHDETSSDSTESILFHWDLEPRNILVKQERSLSSDNGAGGETYYGVWKIDKIIDWDRVQAVPPVLARKPSVWLWDFSDDADNPSLGSDYDRDVDLLPTSRYSADGVDGSRLSVDDQRIKRRFEDSLIDGLAEMYPGYDKATYFDETHGNGRWIRRLARYAIHGSSDNQDVKRFERLEKEWRCETAMEGG